jgi:nucleotide-binding universal stress UspA family protein
MFHQLLLAIDDSPAAPVSVSFAIAKAREHSSSVHVVHVNQYLVGGRGFTVLTGVEANALVDQAVEDLRMSGVQATRSIVRGTCFDVATRIVESAEAWSASAIVLGSHSHRRLRRGQGVRERVTRLSSVPVLSSPAPLKVPRRAHIGVDAHTREHNQAQPIGEPRRESSGPRRTLNPSSSHPHADNSVTANPTRRHSVPIEAAEGPGSSDD